MDRTKNESPADRLLGQLAYVGVEIQSLQVFLPRIDERILTESPLDDKASIGQGLQQLAERQRKIIADLFPDFVFETPPSNETVLAEQLRMFVEEREKFVSALSTLSEEDWNGSTCSGSPIISVLYQMVLEESTILQDVTARLHESNLFRL